MQFKRKILTVGSTFILAASTGYVMQNGDDVAAHFRGPSSAHQQVSASLQPMVVVTPNAVSNTIGGKAPTELEFGTLPRPPSDALQPAPLKPIQNLAERLAKVDAAPAVPVKRPELSPFGLSCTTEMIASETGAAMVALTLFAPCHLGEFVVLSHEGLSVTAQISDAGALSMEFPALVRDASFTVDFANGDKAEASTEITQLDLFDRVAVQWRGDSGLQLHALEYGAGYSDAGHVWVDAPRSAMYADTARGGFVTSLGLATAPEPFLAQVYTFPTGKVHKGGVVRMSIEAEVTAYNCAHEVKAKSLQTQSDGTVSTIDLTLSMPECDAVGDFLVLNNVLDDLEIAQN